MHILRTPTIAFVLVSLLAGCGKNLAVRVTPPGAKADASTAAKVSSADMPVIVELNKDAGTAISAGSLRPYSIIDDEALETGKEAKLPVIAAGKTGDGGLEPSADLFDAPYTDSVSGEKFVFKNIYKFRGFFAMPAEEAIEAVTSVKLTLYGLKKYLPAEGTAGINSAQILCLVDVSQCNGEKTRTGALSSMKLVGGGEFAKIPLPKQYAVFSEGSSLIGQEPGNDALSQNGKVEIELTEYFPDLKTVKGLIAASQLYAEPDLRKMRFVVADGVYFESGGLDVQFKIKADKVDANLGQVWNGPKAGVKDRSKRNSSPESVRKANGEAQKKADPNAAKKDQSDQKKKDGDKTESLTDAEKQATEAKAKTKAEAEAQRLATEKAAKEAEEKAAAEEKKKEDTALGVEALRPEEVAILTSKPATRLEAGKAMTPEILQPVSVEAALNAYRLSEAKSQIMLEFGSNKPKSVTKDGMEDASKSRLKQFLKELNQKHLAEIEDLVVIGYTDRSRVRGKGESEGIRLNQELSERRALEVGRAALAAGFSVRSAGAGEVSETHPECRKPDCRLDRKVLVGIRLKGTVTTRLEVANKIEALAQQVFGNLYVDPQAPSAVAQSQAEDVEAKPEASKSKAKAAPQSETKTAPKTGSAPSPNPEKKPAPAAKSEKKAESKTGIAPAPTKRPVRGEATGPVKSGDKPQRPKKS